VTLPELTEHIKARSIDDGGCWIWQGCVQVCGTTPTMRVPETRKTASVRRLLLTAKGVDVKGKLATYTCESPLCVHPEHTAAVTRKKLQERIGHDLPMSSRMKRNAVTTERMRTKSTLDWGKVAEIRASDEPIRTLAARYGVSTHTIWNVKRGKTWVERSAAANPFAQLLAA
jgi:hypothetical protein